MILKPFTAVLVRSLDKESHALPLCEEDRTRLLAQLPPDESALLVLRDDVYTEEIEVENTCGQLVIKARGLGSTEARKFPRGSVLCFEVTVSVVQHLICSYDCCAEEPCPAEPVTVAAFYAEDGQTGRPWTGLAVFSGSTPMQLAVSQLPGWMTAEIGENSIRLTGTPTGLETVQLSVAGTNAAGTVTTAHRSFTVTA
jgi:hypothetical protein